MTKFTFTFLTISFTWFDCFKNQNRVFCTKRKVLRQKCIKRYFFENPALTNPNLYWVKIWCVLLEQWSQGPWSSFTSSTEVENSFPLLHNLEVLKTCNPLSNSDNFILLFRSGNFLLKTSRESQNAALRTSHRLSICKVVFT